jgi:hypothetical protein
MSSFRRRLMLAVATLAGYLADWFRSDGWFRSEPW